MKKENVIFLLIFLLNCGTPPRQKALAVLEEGLKDESAVIRVNAAKACKEIGDARGIETLYETLNSDDKNGVVAALAALYDLGEKTYSPIVVKLTSDRDPLIRSEAYRLMSLIDDERCHDVFIKGIQDKIAKIRRFSYLGLEKFKDKKNIRRGLSDLDPLVRITSAMVLGRIGEKDMENFIRRELTIPPNINVWKHGVLALAQLGDTSAVSFIKDLLVDTPWELRVVAAEALLLLNNKDGVEVLKQALDSGDPFVRVKAVQVLKDNRIPEGDELLRAAAEDEYINVSIVAIEALARRRAKENRELFIKLMSAPNPLVKIAAAGAYLRSE